MQSISSKLISAAKNPDKNTCIFECPYISAVYRCVAAADVQKAELLLYVIDDFCLRCIKEVMMDKRRYPNTVENHGVAGVFFSFLVLTVLVD